MLLYLNLGDWYDYDGKKLTYLNWAPNQPNHSKGPQDYASIFLSDGTWGDYNDDPKDHGWNPGQVVCLQQLNSPGMYIIAKFNFKILIIEY